jgi:hypothetical protein
LQTFGKPDRLLTCECERNEDTTLGQAFQLITGDLINGALGEADNYLGRLLASNEGEAQVIDHLYLAALSRHPTKVEAARQQELVARSRNRRVALEDLAWALLNSKEFLLRP